MASVRHNLNRRYKRATNRIKKESLILDRARGRKYYWAKVVKDLEYRLGLIKDGQLEMPFN